MSVTRCSPGPFSHRPTRLMETRRRVCIAGTMWGELRPAPFPNDANVVLVYKQTASALTSVDDRSADDCWLDRSTSIAIPHHHINLYQISQKTSINRTELPGDLHDHILFVIVFFLALTLIARETVVISISSDCSRLICDDGRGQQAKLA
jgi:hypothetical protein